MKINNKELNIFSSVLINREISTMDFESDLKWLSNDTIEQNIISQNFNFKTIRLTFLVDEKGDEQKAYEKICALTAELKQSDILFDDIQLTFPCVIVDSSYPERLKNGVFKVSYILKTVAGLGAEVTLVDTDIAAINAGMLHLKYYLDWSYTMSYYAYSFDTTRFLQHEEDIYIDFSTLSAKISAASNWQELALSIGIDLDKYKQENTYNGKINTSLEYSLDNAIELLQYGTIEINYHKFKKNNFSDFPLSTMYPSHLWSAPKDNVYYFDLGKGSGIDIQDLSVIITGRYYDEISAGNGSIIGTGEDGPLNMAMTSPNVEYITDSVASFYTSKVYNSSSISGAHYIIVTLEDLSSVPIREYGFKSSNQSSITDIKGFTEIIYNSLVIDKKSIESFILPNNFTLLNGEKEIGKGIEICRVKIYNKEELILDAIPLANEITNCAFVNTYDTGFFDMVSMRYLPWMKTDGTQGLAPQYSAPIPLSDGTPEPQPLPTEDILFYEKIEDIAGESYLGENSVPIEIYPYDQYSVFVYAVPNEVGVFTFTDATNFNITISGVLADGRSYIEFEVSTGSSITNQSITFTPTDTSKEPYTETFDILNFA